MNRTTPQLRQQQQVTDAARTVDDPPKSAPPRVTVAERRIGSILARSYKTWTALAIADLVKRLGRNSAESEGMSESEKAALLLLLLRQIDDWRLNWQAQSGTRATAAAVEEIVSQAATQVAKGMERAIERTGVAPVPSRSVGAIAMASARIATQGAQAANSAFVSQAANLAQKSMLVNVGTPGLDTLRDQIRDLAASGTRRAKLRARDMVGDMVAATRKSVAEANGITHFVWRTQGDTRVRDSHRGFEGKVYSYAEGSPEGLPSQPVNCRCWDEPVRV
jgi:SPP1 gp7 family putative phage head morphogenesis protein